MNPLSLFNLKLISNWTVAWKFFSVQSNAVGLALLATYLLLPENLQAVLPTWLLVTIAVVILVGGTLGRLLAQPTVVAEPNPNDEPVK